MSQTFITDKMKENLDKYIIFNEDVVDIIFRYPDRVLVYNHDTSGLSRFMGFGLDILYDDSLDILLNNPDKLLGEYKPEFITKYIEYYYFKKLDLF